ncbi:MAG: hypothetical protein R2824_23655 [Saprospiraceae bacterium]|nr:hypothetical protein [Lewinella sp.]
MNYFKTALLIFINFLSISTLSAQENAVAVSNENKVDLICQVQDLEQFRSLHDILPINEHCQILSFGVLRVPKMKDGSLIQEFFGHSADFNEKILKMLGNCQPGDRLYFDNIRTVADCSQYQGNGGTSYVIEVK